MPYILVPEAACISVIERGHYCKNMIMHVILTMLVTASLTVSARKQDGDVNSFLPYCAHLSGNLSRHHRHQLRVQVEQDYTIPSYLSCVWIYAPLESFWCWFSLTCWTQIQEFARFNKYLLDINNEIYHMEKLSKDMAIQRARHPPKQVLASSFSCIIIFYILELFTLYFISYLFQITRSTLGWEK